MTHRKGRILNSCTGAEEELLDEVSCNGDKVILGVRKEFEPFDVADEVCWARECALDIP
jgi:hypothetical protein